MTDADEIPPPAPRASSIPDLADPRLTEPSKPLTERPATERPPTAQALAAWSVDFELKFFRQQAENHRVQLEAIREGQTAMLRSFQETVSNTIARIEAEFGKALEELRQKRHATANDLNALKLELQERHAAEDKRAELVEKRLKELETWQLKQVKRDHPEPPIDPSPRSGS